MYYSNSCKLCFQIVYLYCIRRGSLFGLGILRLYPVLSTLETDTVPKTLLPDQPIFRQQHIFWEKHIGHKENYSSKMFSKGTVVITDIWSQSARQTKHSYHRPVLCNFFQAPHLEKIMRTKTYPEHLVVDNCKTVIVSMNLDMRVCEYVFVMFSPLQWLCCAHAWSSSNLGAGCWTSSQLQAIPNVCDRRLEPTGWPRNGRMRARFFSKFAIGPTILYALPHLYFFFF